MGTCVEQSLATHPFHAFCCKYGGARSGPHRAVRCALRRLIKQAGGYADMVAPCPGALRLGERQRRGSTCDAVRYSRCGLWVPGCLAAVLERRQRAMPASRTLQRKCVATRSGCSCWRKRRKRNVMEWPCVRWSSRLVEDWAARAPNCCVIR